MDLVGQTLGQYRITEPVGAGGMATVYKAYQAGLDRYVAVKVLPSQHANTPGFKERFTREARAVAQLSHPNILPIYDFGIQDGLSYFVMKYVPDHTLAHMMGQPMALSRVSHFLDQVAGALDHAHERGVVHRDVKPSNMLLEGEWLLLADFGLAKIVAGSQMLTATGATLGTPAYISPEQAEGKPVDHRTDIYSLGIVLYEMVTGRVPYEGETPVGVIFKHIFEPLPIPRSLNPGLSEDVERVILKAVAKDSNDRYDKAGEMAADLRQVLDQAPPFPDAKAPVETLSVPESVAGTSPAVDLEAPTVPPEPEPVTAPATTRSVSQLLGGGGLALTGIGLLLLIAVGGLVITLAQGDDQATEQTPAQGVATEQADALPTDRLSSTLPPTLQPTDRPAASPVPAGAPIDADNLHQVEELFRLGRGTINAVSASPDGTRLAVASSLGIWLYDAETLNAQGLLDGHAGPVTAVAWSSDGARLASAGKEETVCIWDAASGKELRTLVGHVGIVSSVAWSPDGTQLASGGWDETVRVWDVSSGRELEILTSHTEAVLSLAWSPNGAQLASASRDGTVRLWDVAEGREMGMLESDGKEVRDVAWSPDGQRLASASQDGIIRLWDAASGEELRRLDGHTTYVESIAWSPDSTRLASGALDRSLRVWDVVSGAELQMFKGHDEPVRGVDWLSDGAKLVSGGDDGALRVWDVANGVELQMVEGHLDAALSVAWSSDGTRLAMGAEDGKVWIWSFGEDPTSASEEAAARLLLYRLEGHSSEVNSVTWSPDGAQLASGGGTLDNDVLIWDPSTGGAPRVLEQHSSAVTSVAWSPDGQRLASAGWDNVVHLWDATGRLLDTLEEHPDWVTSLAWSPDGMQLATGCKDGMVRIWSAEDGQPQQTLEGHTDQVTSVDWSPNGIQVASASWDDTVRVWSLLTKDGNARESLVLKAPGSVADVAWSPDGAYLATVSSFWDNLVRIWDVSTGRELHSLEGHVDSVVDVAWSPDGTRLASASEDGTVRVWGIPSMQ